MENKKEEERKTNTPTSTSKYFVYLTSHRWITWDCWCKIDGVVMFLYKQPVAVRGKVKFEMEFWELQEDMADQLHIPCLEAPPPPKKKNWFDIAFKWALMNHSTLSKLQGKETKKRKRCESDRRKFHLRTPWDGRMALRVLGVLGLFWEACTKNTTVKTSNS